MESIYSQSDSPPGPPYGSNWGHKIVDFVFLPYISFIIAFTALVSSSIIRVVFYWTFHKLVVYNVTISSIHFYFILVGIFYI